MRKVLDALYAVALAIACLAMVAIAVLVLVQILGRVLDRALIFAGATPLGFSIPSLSDFGGFLFVASATLALPATLRAGGHVRVSLLLNIGGPVVQRILGILVLMVALGLAGFATWHSGLQVLDSWRFNAVSFGMVQVPLWIPQGVMTLGFGLLLVAVADELVTALRGQVTSFQRAEDQRSAGGH
ncbi:MULTISPECIES: TRAP transporter small permease [unclassified Yoonia]|uniref:TRAP transporter small permease n=1 Tax=unclassified Yoonia TaxID=2629118 RepID=UPI002B002EB0|nr:MULTISPECIES: TRAP transporter small permease subunit [unclassified Yoonia]